MEAQNPLKNLVFAERSEALKSIAKSYGLVTSVDGVTMEYIERLRVTNYILRQAFYAFSSDGASTSSRIFNMRTKKGTKLNRILLEQFPQEESTINKISEACKPHTYELIVSVRKHDIARKGRSRYFKTCLSFVNGTNYHQLIEELQCPYTAVAFLKDKQGQMAARCTLAEAWDSGQFWISGVQYGDKRLSIKKLLEDAGIKFTNDLSWKASGKFYKE